MEKNDLVSIRGNSFVFRMSDCHKIKYGFCPIEKRKFDIECFCNELLKELIATDFKMYCKIPSVCGFTGCGHISCTDGQHRICIAGKLGIEIEVRYMNDLEGKCTVCAPWYINHTDCKEFVEKF